MGFTLNILGKHLWYYYCPNYVSSSNGWKNVLIEPFLRRSHLTIVQLPVLVITKVLENIINCGTLSYFEQHNLLHESQYGFRRQRSAVDLP